MPALDVIITVYSYVLGAAAALFTFLRLAVMLRSIHTARRTLSTSVLSEARNTFKADEKIDGFLKTIERENLFRTIFKHSIPVEKTGPLMDIYNTGGLTIGQLKCAWNYHVFDGCSIRFKISFLDKLQSIIIWILVGPLTIIGVFLIAGGLTLAPQAEVVSAQALFTGAFSLLLAVYMLLLSVDVLIASKLLANKKIP